ncbi:MAG: phosphatase PAP2 family protein [Spirochaetaceae bacterium]|nr:phosphatase PAP2 family protein [Spirochaetaceae bacterium]
MRIFCRKTIGFLLVFSFTLPLRVSAEETAAEALPVSKLFHGIGKNAVASLLFNDGLNFITAAMGSYLMIDSGFDWQYNRFVYKRPALINGGYPSLFIGYIMPFASPIAFYMAGRGKTDQKLQAAGLALGQSLLLSVAYSAVLKGITGRASPGITDILDHERSSDPVDYSNEFEWGFGKMGFIAGWPSGHTMNAFAAAAALSEIYHDNLPVKAASYSYAVLIGLGVSWCVHWSSEVFAGALIGYAIGKTVGRGFSKLLNNEKTGNIALYVTPNTVGFRISV